MWDKRPRKTLYLLNVEGFAPEVTALTYPLIYRWAARIGAEVHQITERRFPDWPVTFEKLQIFRLSQEHQNDWNLYLDSDALVHPETIDPTEHLPRDTVLHNGADMGAVRWRYDRYFRRDGRNIGSCNWFSVASDLCIDLWRPLEDLTLPEALANIFPTAEEERSGVISREHLIDDYTLSRNIAQYGLKFTTFITMLKGLGLADADFFWHLYTIPPEEKVKQMQETLVRWKLVRAVP